MNCSCGFTPPSVWIISHGQFVQLVAFVFVVGMIVGGIIGYVRGKKSAKKQSNS